MPAERRRVERGLVGKGFRKADGDHHYFIYYTIDHRKTIVKTKTSHGMRELDDGLISQMARQCKLSRVQFMNLVDCPLSRKEYEEILHSQDPSLL